MAEKGTNIQIFLGYLITITTHKFAITATILIINIFLICRAQFMEISCQEYASEKRFGITAIVDGIKRLET